MPTPGWKLAKSPMPGAAGAARDPPSPAPAVGAPERAVAHRDAAARLEVGEVPHAGRRVDRAVPPVARPVRPVELELVEALEVPGEGAARAVDLEAHADVRPDASPAVLHRPAGAVLEPEEAAHVVLVLDGAHLTVLDREVARAHALRHLGPLTDKGLPLGRDALDGAYEVLGHIHRVGHDVPEHAEARAVELVAPGQGAVRVGGVVGEKVAPVVRDLPEVPGHDELLRILHYRDMAVHQADHAPHAGLLDRPPDV